MPTWTRIDSWINTAIPGDNAHIELVYTNLADMLSYVLNFLIEPGTPAIVVHPDPPERLKEKSFPNPEILLLPAEAGVAMTPMTFGGTTEGHPGGQVRYQWIVQAFAALGRSTENSAILAKRTLKWLKYIDAAIRQNTTLSGLVMSLNPLQARWGELEYSEEAYWGWAINVRITTEYERRTGNGG